MPPVFYGIKIEKAGSTTQSLERYAHFHNLRSLNMIPTIEGHTLGTLITIFTNMFTGSQDHERIVTCHARREWVHPGPFIM